MTLKKIQFILIAVLAVFLLSMPLLSGCGKVAQFENKDNQIKITGFAFE